MRTGVPFDKEKFLNECSCGCSKGRQVILDKIEQYKESEPEMVQYLEWYRDDLWDEQVKKDTYHKMRFDRGDDQLENDTVIALRALADKLEQKGSHFMIHCELPPLPIFSGKDSVEKYYSHIVVTVARCPLGG